MQGPIWSRAARCTWEWRDPRRGDRSFVIVGRQRSIGGAGRGLGVGRIEMECQGDVQRGLLEMPVCGGGEE